MTFHKLFKQVITLLAVVIPLTIFLFQRDTRRLECSVLEYSFITGVNNNLDGKLQLLFEGNEIRNISFLSLVIRNSGNEHLQPENSSDDSDIRNPKFIIKFEEKTRILSTNLVSYGNDLSSIKKNDPSLSINEISYNVFLLNRSAAVRIDFVLSDYFEKSDFEFLTTGFGMSGRKIPIDRTIDFPIWLLLLIILFSFYFSYFILQDITIKLSCILFDRFPRLAGFILSNKKSQAFLKSKEVENEDEIRFHSIWLLNSYTSLILSISICYLIYKIGKHFLYFV